MLGYAAAVVCFVPGSVLTLAAGAIFGLVEGTLTSSSRRARIDGGLPPRALPWRASAIARRVEGEPALRRDRPGHRARGPQDRLPAAALAGLSRSQLLNYALGLTRVRLVDYLVASIGMLPGTLLYVYSGKVAGDVATLAGGAAAPRGAGY